MKQGDVAKHLDLSIRRLREHYQRGDIDKTADLDTQRVQYIRVLRERAANRVPTGVLDPAQEKAGLDRARRLEVEQRLAEKSRELIPAAEVGDAWEKQVRIARARLLAMPSRVAYGVVQVTDLREAERIVREEVFSALTELAGGAEAEPDKDAAAD